MKYVIDKDVHGAIGTEPYKFTAGTVTPKNDIEKAALERLVVIGAAKRKETSK